MLSLQHRCVAIATCLSAACLGRGTSGRPLHDPFSGPFLAPPLRPARNLPPGRRAFFFLAGAINLLAGCRGVPVRGDVWLLLSSTIRLGWSCNLQAEPFPALPPHRCPIQ